MKIKTGRRRISRGEGGNGRWREANKKDKMLKRRRKRRIKSKRRRRKRKRRKNTLMTEAISQPCISWLPGFKSSSLAGIQHSPPLRRIRSLACLSGNAGAGSVGGGLMGARRGTLSFGGERGVLRPWEKGESALGEE